MSASGKIHYLPERISGLSELALNLWWRWDRRARTLLKSIDPPLWSATRHNPVAMLRGVDPSRLAQLAQDREFVAAYDDVMEDFRAAAAAKGTWFRDAYPDLSPDHPVAYFCAEFGLHNSIPIYSGGLGVLAGGFAETGFE